MNGMNIDRIGDDLAAAYEDGYRDGFKDGQKKKGLPQRTNPTETNEIIVNIPSIFKEEQTRLFKELVKCEILIRMKRSRKSQKELRQNRQDIIGQIESLYIEVVKFYANMAKIQAKLQDEVQGEAWKTSR